MTQILSVSPQKPTTPAKITKILHPVVERVHTALSTLHSLKAHRYTKYWKYREEYAQRNTPNVNEDGYTNYHMNTWFAIINTKASELATSTPKYDFVALDDNGKKNKRVRELFWKYVWQESRTDAAIMECWQDALKYWIGVGEEIILNDKRTIKEPYILNWKIEYRDKEIVEYAGCKLVHIPWWQVYMNWRNIENTTEAIVISYWDRDEFLLKFGNDGKFSWISDKTIPKGKYYYVGTNTNTLTVDGSSGSTDRSSSSIENENTVSVLTYYNKYRDEYIVLANDVWINPIKTVSTEGDQQENIQPIPYPHKEIPLVVYTDHIVDDDIYWLGEFDITERSRKFKDDIRSIHIEGIKAQGWIITIGPDSDYDETVMKLGMRQVARVEKDSFWFFAPNINLQSLAALEMKADEDIVIECGVDFKSQLLGQNETARRTEWRIDASKKRINHNIKHNAYTFYERLARLRSANFEFFYKNNKTKLPIKWMEVDDKWNVEYVQNWYGLFTMKPEYFKGKISLIPIVDSLFWNTSNDTKTKYLEELQLLMNMKDERGAPVFDPKLLVEAWRWIMEWVIDIDKIMGKSKDNQSPEDIMKDAGIWTPSQVPTSEEQGIPPAQQSWAPVLIGSSAKSPQ